jgi:hypothetical protein
LKGLKSLKSLKGLKGLRFEELLSPACRIYLPQVEASSLLLALPAAGKFALFA